MARRSPYCGFETSSTHTEIKRLPASSSDCSILSLASSVVCGVQPSSFVGRHLSASPNHKTR